MFCLSRVLGCFLARLFVLLKVANRDVGHVCTIGAKRDLSGVKELREEHCNQFLCPLDR